MDELKQITYKEFKAISEYIEDNYGIHLRDEKQTLVAGRLGNELISLGFESFTEYFEYVKEDSSGDAVIKLIDKITTNHTFFMREAEHFYYYRDKVLPYFKNTIKDNDLRVWCAACSTGEEAYTLAFITDEFLATDKKVWDKKILATDISSKVLHLAEQGVYSNDRIAPLPNKWRLTYFEKYDSDNWVVKKEMKNEVIYRKFNLMDRDFPFRKKFHVIFCRNVMIYFDNETKERLVNKFYDALSPGGYLFIGHSESINKEATKLRYIMPSIYRKE